MDVKRGELREIRDKVIAEEVKEACPVGLAKEKGDEDDGAEEGRSRNDIRLG